MMKWLKSGCTAVMAAALLLWPETALNAAREAMYIWYKSVAPALFPFMALMPMLTAPGASEIWERALGGATRRLFGLPGSAAPAVAAGLIAGTPAGAHAAARIRAGGGMSAAQLERVVCCAGGFSPAFLITGVGAAMLGNPADGRMLLQAQLMAQLSLLMITRRAGGGERRITGIGDRDVDPVRTAVTGTLNVCGYMILFNTGAALLSSAMRNPAAGLTALCLLDVPSAAAAISVLSIEREAKLILLAALTGFGGLCAAAQNLNAVRETGVRAGKYMKVKAVQSALTAGFMALRLKFSHAEAGNHGPSMEFFALAAAFFAAPALFSLKKDLFLNKINSENSTEK